MKTYSSGRLENLLNPTTSLTITGLEQWLAPTELRQVGLSFNYPQTQKYRKPRQHDWLAIKNHLKLELTSPVVRSLAEIAKGLDIYDRHLYIRVTDEARMVGERYVQHLHRQARHNELQQLQQLREVAGAIRRQGEYATVDAVTHILGKSKVSSIRSLYSTLSLINLDLDAANEEL